MLSLAERLGKDLGRFGQGKRELKGLIGKRQKEDRRKEGLRTRQGFGKLTCFFKYYINIPTIVNKYIIPMYKKLIENSYSPKINT